MSRIKFGALLTTIIGALWALLSLIFYTTSDRLVEEFITGFVIAAVGISLAVVVAWWENRQ